MQLDMPERLIQEVVGVKMYEDEQKEMTSRSLWELGLGKRKCGGRYSNPDTA